MRNWKSFTAILILLLGASTVVSASPILNDWAFALADSSGGIGFAPNAGTGFGSVDSELSGADASTLTTVTLDAGGLGNFDILVTNTSGTAQPFTVTAWLQYFFADSNPNDATVGETFNTGFYGGTGNDALLNPSIESWDIANGLLYPLDDTNYVPSSAANDTGPSDTWSAAPLLALSTTKDIAAGASVLFTFSTRWVPAPGDPTDYSLDPYVVSSLLPPGVAFYLTEQALNDGGNTPNLGTMEFYAPEPGTWMLISGGIILLLARRSRRRA